MRPGSVLRNARGAWLYTVGMIIRRSSERGFADHGWLRSFHTFSFADYHDPAHMGFRALRVINEDRVAQGRGFGEHQHRDMEILSYDLDGELEHRDSLGNGQIIRPGDIQRMSAGTGVLHSEFNPSKDRPVHFLQIWLQPSQRGIPPGYEQRRIEPTELRGRLRLVASSDARDGSVLVHQDVQVFAALLAPGQAVSHAVAAGRHAWLHVARGRLALGSVELSAGDAAATSEPETLDVRAVEDAELLLFDLA